MSRWSAFTLFRNMCTISVRAGVTSLVTAFATMANAPIALADLPEHTLVAEFSDADVDALPPGEFHDFGFGEGVAIRNDVAFIGVPRARDNGHVLVLNLTATGWKQVQRLTAPNSSAQSNFGRTLTFRDGVLVVNGENAAHVFKRGSNGLFTFRQTLRPPTADGVDRFPVALRYEGGTLLAGAFRRTAPSVVYVFERDSTGRFVRRAKVKAADGTAGDSFGASISMTKRLFIVGSPGDAAYTFRRNSSGNWVQAQKLVPAVPAPGFGTAVAIDQDMILVGAPSADMEGGASGGPPTSDDHVAGGAVFGFLPGVSGYIESFKLRPRPDERFEYEQFGSEIAMSGVRIAVKATGFRAPVTLTPDGLVFTYTRNGSSVLARGITSRQAEISAMDLSNNALLIGAIIESTVCRFVCIRTARIYDDNLFEQ
jgi:FG-GAP repeat